MNNKAVYTAKDAFTLVLPVILVENSTFAGFQLVCDRRTDGPTDTPSFMNRDARTHLKTDASSDSTAFSFNKAG